MDGTGYLATSPVVVFRIDFYVDSLSPVDPWFHRVEIRDLLKDASVSMHKREEMKIRKLCVEKNTNTVDGRNPAPPGIYKTLYINNGIFTISTGAGFLLTVSFNIQSTKTIFWATLFRHLKCCEPAHLQTELDDLNSNNFPSLLPKKTT